MLRLGVGAVLIGGNGMPHSNAPERFSEWNELMVARHDPEDFYHHPRRVVRWIEGSRIAAMLAVLDARPAHRVLDAGCGAGNLLERIAAQDKHGVDLSRKIGERAHKRLDASATIVHGDAEQLPYRDGSFDRVVCSSVLAHSLHPEQVLAECFRVLKPGGRLAVSVSLEDRIERGIRIARMLLLARMLMGPTTDPSEAGQHVYTSEYHLHRFDLPALREAAAKLPPETALRKVPAIFPVHVVALYVK